MEEIKNIIIMDGTFSSCPALWDQVYILHARKDCSTYSLVFDLLQDRQMTTYRRLFRLLKNHVQEKLQQQLASARIQTDFEIAAIQAIHAEFPNAEVKGCFFHYSHIEEDTKPWTGCALQGRSSSPTVDQEISRSGTSSGRSSSGCMAGGYGCNSCSSTRRRL